MPSELTKQLVQNLRNLGLLDGPLRPGTRVGVAVSGGADSVALLRLLAELRAALGLALSVVHFNHKLRGKASDRDERFVLELAERLGLTVHTGRGDVAREARHSKANLENAARKMRYRFFARLAEQGVVETVVTAHTMDDQAETVLAHVLRGTGIRGLAGIHPISGCVVRPLLGVRRQVLRRYLRAVKQKWREDATNRDLTKNRARMRKALLPVLERQFNPAVVEHLAALAERALEESKLIEALALRVIETSVSFSQSSFSPGGDTGRSGPTAARVAISELLGPLRVVSNEGGGALRARVILEIAERVRQKSGQVLSEHVERILQLAKAGEPGKRLQIPGGIDVLRQRAHVVFERRAAKK